MKLLLSIILLSFLCVGCAQTGGKTTNPSLTIEEVHDSWVWVEINLQGEVGDTETTSDNATDVSDLLEIPTSLVP